MNTIVIGAHCFQQLAIAQINLPSAIELTECEQTKQWFEKKVDGPTASFDKVEGLINKGLSAPPRSDLVPARAGKKVGVR